MIISVVVYDLAQPELGFRDLIPQNQHATLSNWHVFGAYKLVIVYLEDVKKKLFLYDLATGQKIKQIGQDLEGDCSTLGGELYNDEIFIGCTSFTNPFTMYR